MKVLVIEDEEKLSDAIARGLKLNGYTVDIVADGKKALTRLSLNRSDYDVVVLDLMLPSMDGHEICKRAREMGVLVPILVLTARNETEKKVELLLSGADDYLVKPFAFEELLARLRALLRRPKETMPEILHVKDIELNVLERKVSRDGHEIPLTLKEFSILEYFMRHPNMVVNREDLLSNVWDFNYAAFSNILDVHIKNIRRKLTDHGKNEDILQTVRGIGYRLVAEV